jgi:hypothetical protein
MDNCADWSNFYEFDNTGLDLLKFDSDNILVPKKIEYNLRKYVSKKLLRDIDGDLNTAIEKCLLVASNLCSTYYSENKWKHLYWQVLHEQTKKDNDNTTIYRKIINLLKDGTSTGSFIEIKENKKGGEHYIWNSTSGTYSKQYRLTDTYLKAGLIRYQLKTDYLIERRRAHFFSTLSSATENTIGKNLINVYGKLSVPNTIELLKIGKKLVKNNFITKKNKILTVRNKHVDEYWSDVTNRSFVEDNLKLFNYLTDGGYIVPIVSEVKNGNRVVDSFTLMPSWIRNQIKINGEETVEIDFKCLHPNIASTLYGGNIKNIKHEVVAKDLGIDIKTVKIEHLSFFNKEIWQMKQSILFDYYNKHENWMLSNIINDKHNNGYKVTTQKMFSLETDIMTEVIKTLNSENIYVLYIYDALLVSKSSSVRVKEVMNQVIISKKIYTNAE